MCSLQLLEVIFTSIVELFVRNCYALYDKDNVLYRPNNNLQYLLL